MICSLVIIQGSEQLLICWVGLIRLIIISELIPFRPIYIRVIRICEIRFVLRHNKELMKKNAILTIVAKGKTFLTRIWTSNRVLFVWF